MILSKLFFYQGVKTSIFRCEKENCQNEKNNDLEQSSDKIILTKFNRRIFDSTGQLATWPFDLIGHVQRIHDNVILILKFSKCKPKHTRRLVDVRLTT